MSARSSESENPAERHARSIRRRIIELTGKKGFGHIGGSMSIVEILTVLYSRTMKIDPKRPEWVERDRFILSKGHATPAYYSTLAEFGYFPEERLFEEYDEVNGHFQGHPDMTKTPGVDMTTGSLGQGLSAGIGMALGGAKRGWPTTVFVLLGDGEMQEGQVWEAVMYAGLRKTPHLVAILDNNRLQLTAVTKQILPMAPYDDKLTAFGWNVLNCDGHDLEALTVTLDEAKRLAADGPVFVIANTVKGKGVSFMENRVEWHSKACSKEEMMLALKELE
jgi:transketolase